MDIDTLEQMTKTQAAKMRRQFSPDPMGSVGVPLAGSFKKGGKVRKTGLAKVHKGERVLTKSQTRRYSKGKA